MVLCFTWFVTASPAGVFTPVLCVALLSSRLMQWCCPCLRTLPSTRPPRTLWELGWTWQEQLQSRGPLTPSTTSERSTRHWPESKRGGGGAAIILAKILASRRWMRGPQGVVWTFGWEGNLSHPTYKSCIFTCPEFSFLIYQNEPLQNWITLMQP